MLYSQTVHLQPVGLDADDAGWHLRGYEGTGADPLRRAQQEDAAAFERLHRKDVERVYALRLPLNPADRPGRTGLNRTGPRPPAPAAGETSGPAGRRSTVRTMNTTHPRTIEPTACSPASF
jgi:hypothetical protein